MQEEVEQKSVNLAVKSSKVTVQVLYKGLNKNGLVEIRRVQVSEELIKMNQPLSRLWINGLLGGVPELL